MKATIPLLALAMVLGSQALAQTCALPGMRLETRAGSGFKKKVGFGSYDLAQPYRYFLTNTWTQSVSVTGYSAPSVPESGSMSAVYSHAAHYDRYDDLGDPIFHDSSVNITATLSYPGVSGSSSYNGVYTTPKPTALAYAEVLGSDRVLVWDYQPTYGVQKLFLNMWSAAGDSESTAGEVRTLTELWFDRRTMTLATPETGTRYGLDYHGYLVSEYTTAMLIADARGRAINALSSTWSEPDCPLNATLTSTLALETNERNATADVTVWRATLEHVDYGTTYEVRWLEWFVPETGPQSEPTLRRKAFPGTGMGTSVVVEVPLPSSRGTTYARVLGVFPVNSSNDSLGAGSPSEMGGGCCGGGGRGVDTAAHARYSISL